MKQRQAYRRWYYNHLDEVRAYNRVRRRAYRLSHPERVAAALKRWRSRHREDALMRGRIWHADHREEANRRRSKHYYANREAELQTRRAWGQNHREHLAIYNREYRRQHHSELFAYDRERYQQRRRSQQPYIPLSERSQRARELETEVIALRDEGWTWREVAELTGKPLDTCQTAYYRAMKRRQAQQDEQSA